MAVVVALPFPSCLSHFHPPTGSGVSGKVPPTASSLVLVLHQKVGIENESISTDKCRLKVNEQVSILWSQPPDLSAKRHNQSAGYSKDVHTRIFPPADDSPAEP